MPQLHAHANPTFQSALHAEGHITKVTSGTLFTYNGDGQLAQELTNCGTNATRYLTQEHLGSTRAISDATGLVKARTNYYPYGEEIAVSSGQPRASIALRQPFPGKERDAETGLDFFGARYMASAQGRFTSPDPGTAGADPLTPQSWNAYSYDLNNPLHFVDPDGAAPYPATTWKVNKSLFGDPQLARVMCTANNYSPAAFQRSIESGEFGGQDPLSTPNDRKVLGFAAEAVVADMVGRSIINFILNGDMRIQTVPRESGGVAPDLRLHLGNKPVMTENIVGAPGGVKVMNAKFVDFQVKATTNTAYMLAGAAQTVKNANSIASMGGVAILAIDKAAWGGLSGKQQQAIMNAIPGGKGRAYIQLFEGLNDEAKRRAQGAIERAQ